MDNLIALFGQKKKKSEEFEEFLDMDFETEIWYMIYADSENPINSVEMYISADQTVDLEPGKYVYDVIMTNVDTEEHDKILEGLIFILQSITRPYSDEQ
jgi:hypothetical protein